MSSQAKLDQKTQEMLDAAVSGLFPPGSTTPAGERVGPNDESNSHTEGNTTSRQAQHARSVRQNAMGTILCYLRAPHEEEFAKFVLTPAYARLRPYSALCHTRAHYAVTQGRFSFSGHERLWEGATKRLLELFKTFYTNSRNEIISMNAAFTLMLADSVIFGARCTDCFRDTHEVAKQHGLLEIPFFKMQFARMAAYIGATGPAMDFFMDTDSMNIEMSNVYAFVRRDNSKNILDRTASITLGKDIRPELSLFRKNPYSTIGNLISYIRMTIRNPVTFSNEATVLMALNWLPDITKRIVAGRRKGMPDHTFNKLHRELQKLERVQIHEKNRFWDVLDSMPPGKARDRMSSFWNQSPTQLILA